MAFWTALLTTVGAETVVATLLLRLLGVEQPRLVLLSLFMLAINLISHPLGWHAVANLEVPWGGVETCVMLLEILLVRAFLFSKLWHAGLVAVTANGITMVLSLAGSW